ncbi:phosphate signaling complex protein PhoU [Liquorilactobacillus satsumensis]|uniref:Phosphate-specific transport system accessory protein PhoU n=1 Tax=Liquorilactobacillus satsumensis DSM 16230 = JCM 12392 TaxID=1423801 RepID=A0A0R1UXU0_9LACO|nr:phosphate signaling complex protein PhoU [Liquorilactobacillus satsumensis]KRL98095.1 phosphate transport system regulatory protein PhoU [Liquorilactobacillus satsumensis DSM 16230 = JCM 12392]MCC7667349.1 phosphate transport system regulatory protein PhoU [Liquorilactobacillus satsumensis]MCP9313780.1 phosphate signaling complex protein PhoU [Liquorilactobacillus satsumensis]MCP9329460.1 phosphate signaling complex protein PhoU [Liquorilactobacillus satsumensis]MCP9358211.1 phosphate signa
MRKILEEQLSDLHEDFAQMGREVAQAIENATKVFQSHDKELANKVGENDNRINESEIYLERKTAQVIALQQPVASDLRVLITILKASSDLERIGDHAVSVAHAAMRIGDQRRNKEIEDTLVGLSKHVHQMLVAIIKAYVDNNEEDARQVAKLDSESDEYLRDVRRLAVEEMQSDPEFVTVGSEYLVVGTHLERIGDYVTNVAEWIVYTNTGRIVELGPISSYKKE